MQLQTRHVSLALFLQISLIDTDGVKQSYFTCTQHRYPIAMNFGDPGSVCVPGKPNQSLQKLNNAFFEVLRCL